MTDGILPNANLDTTEGTPDDAVDTMDTNAVVSTGLTRDATVTTTSPLPSTKFTPPSISK